MSHADEWAEIRAELASLPDSLGVDFVECVGLSASLKTGTWIVRGGRTRRDNLLFERLAERAGRLLDPGTADPAAAWFSHLASRSLAVTRFATIEVSRIIHARELFDDAALRMQSKAGDQTTGAKANRQQARKKKSTTKGDAEAGTKTKITAALTAYHGYKNGGVSLDKEPLKFRELMDLAGVSIGSVHTYMAEQFGGASGYAMACKSTASLADALRHLNGEIPARVLLNPPAVRQRDE